ncbi:helix-turn-helix protein [Tumebacillus sp. BK434]|uniref:winged helix-turn-helix domain-containing protein n=1 Tax=Tumebacillus sp. BK434 TaxID=2512169 RepID=UPI001051F0C6|nr:winged helix-turn-helix domain-containing protein [Tumebacillus sp. BK434]TCP55872.1 helix-turn-helix protein [Tumebacillus sp. BK434]
MNHDSVYEVTSLEQMKALSNKLRVQILNQFDEEPRTSKQLADLLGLPASKVHYHVRELHRTGLLVLVETREKGGVIEKYYLPVAKQIRVALQESDAFDNEERTIRYEMGRAFVDEYLTAYQRSIQLVEQLREAGKPTEGIGPVTSMGLLYLTDEQQQEVRQELKDLLHTWEQRYSQQEKTDQTRAWRAFLSLFPELL